MKNPLTISIFEAKANFSELLARASKGEEITITKHEKPMAKLVPFEKPSRVELATLFQQMKNFGAAHPINPKGFAKISYRDLIDGGRILVKTHPDKS